MTRVAHEAEEELERVVRAEALARSNLLRLSGSPPTPQPSSTYTPTTQSPDTGDANTPTPLRTHRTHKPECELQTDELTWLCERLGIHVPTPDNSDEDGDAEMEVMVVHSSVATTPHDFYQSIMANTTSTSTPTPTPVVSTDTSSVAAVAAARPSMRRRNRSVNAAISVALAKFRTPTKHTTTPHTPCTPEASDSPVDASQSDNDDTQATPVVRPSTRPKPKPHKTLTTRGGMTFKAECMRHNHGRLRADCKRRELCRHCGGCKADKKQGLTSWLQEHCMCETRIAEKHIHLRSRCPRWRCLLAADERQKVAGAKKPSGYCKHNAPCAKCGGCRARADVSTARFRHNFWLHEHCQCEARVAERAVVMEAVFAEREVDEAQVIEISNQPENMSQPEGTSLPESTREAVLSVPVN